MAIGFYKPLKNTSFIVFEGYTGIGFGNTKEYYSTQVVTNYGSLQLLDSRMFIQGNCGVKWKYFEFALSAKLNYVHYIQIKHDIPDYNSKKLDAVNSIINKPSKLIGDFFCTTRMGWKYIKLHIQVGTNTSNQNGPEGFLDFNPLIGNMGLFIDLLNKIWDRFRKK